MRPAEPYLQPAGPAAVGPPCGRLQVVHEIMQDLKVGEYTIKLNHRLLLDAMMRVSPMALVLGFRVQGGAEAASHDHDAGPRQPPMIVQTALGSIKLARSLL